METVTTTRSEFPMEGKPLREIQKSKTVTVTVMEGWKVKYLSKVV